MNMTLHEGEPGTQYTVRGLQLPIRLERRLEALGLMEGSLITVLRKKKRGAMIVTVRGTRFAMGRDISEHISVSERGASHGA